MISGYLSPDGTFYNAPYWSHMSTAQRIVEDNGWFSKDRRDWPEDIILKKRLIDANELKELRDKYIRGEIHFDDECDMIDKCPTVYAVPIEEVEHLRDELYEKT